MCRDSQLFTELHQLKDPLEVVLGDGRAQTAAGRRSVMLKMKLSNGKTRMRKLHNVLFVPQFSYNLLSVSKATQIGKVAKFTKTSFYILNKEYTLIGKVTEMLAVDLLTGVSSVVLMKLDAA